MNEQEILLSLDELLELELGSLKGMELLTDLAAWDSLAVIGLIALADEKFQKALSPNAIAEAKTVNDIVILLSS